MQTCRSRRPVLRCWAMPFLAAEGSMSAARHQSRPAGDRDSNAHSAVCPLCLRAETDRQGDCRSLHSAAVMQLVAVQTQKIHCFVQQSTSSRPAAMDMQWLAWLQWTLSGCPAAARMYPQTCAGASACCYTLLQPEMCKPCAAWNCSTCVLREVALTRHPPCRPAPPPTAPSWG